MPTAIRNPATGSSGHPLRKALACDLIDGELERVQPRRLNVHVEQRPTCPGPYRSLVHVTEFLSKRGAANSET